MKKILIIAPHPDDETLGCGGTILKHKEWGDSITWLIITNVNSSDGWDIDLVKKRQEEINQVAKRYQFEKVINLEFLTTKLDVVPIGEIVKNISKVINEIKPQIIYLNNRNDVHSDHKITFDAAYACTKNFRYPYIERVLIYEALSETEFSPALYESTYIPNVFIDITSRFEEKLEIMSIYKSEVMESNLPRSFSAIKALAGYRGSRIGVKYAEAFQLIFEKI